MGFWPSRVPYFPLSKDMSLCLELRFSLPESKVTPCWLPPLRKVTGRENGVLHTHTQSQCARISGTTEKR